MRCPWLGRISFTAAILCAASMLHATPLLRAGFTTHRIPPGLSVYDAVRADLDGDGRADLITPGLAALQGADGAFGTPFEIMLPTQWNIVSPIFVRDVTGDGRADLVARVRGNGVSLAVAQGRGDGTFEPLSESPFSEEIGDIGSMDANGDGSLDLVVTTLVEVWEYPANYYYVPYGAEVLYQQADGSFTSMPGQEFDPFPAFADVNADGIPDALSGGVRLGRGDGTFAPPLSPSPEIQSPVATADFDHDGNTDLLVGAGLGASPSAATTLLRGHGDGTFDPAIRIGDAARRVFALDWDQDGAIDVAMANLGSITLRRGRRELGFDSPKRLGIGIVGALDPTFVDFDGDGRLELQVFDFWHTGMLPLDPDGTFGRGLGVSLPAAPLWTDTADFDGDGTDDIVIVSEGGRIDIGFGAGDGSFREGPLMQDIWNPVCVRAADLDQDGRMDLAVANHTNAVLSLYYGEPNGTFSDAVLIPCDELTSRVTTCDLDADGRLDLVVATEASHQLVVVRSAGPRGFTPLEKYDIEADIRDLESTDVNGDRRDDIIALTSAGLELFLAKDAGLVRATSVAAIGTRLAVADVTGDGQVDAVIGGPGTLLLAGNGDGSFMPARTLSTAPTVEVALPDLDLDGDPDLVLALADRTVSTAVNDGAGGFDMPEGIPVLSDPTSLAIADWTGDGRVDVAIASHTARRLTLLQNVLPPLAAADAVRVASVPGGVVLRWRIVGAQPERIRGIDVARASAVAGPYATVTEHALLPASEMEFTDHTIPPGTEAWYRLTIHYDRGTSRTVGPYAATAGHWSTRWHGIVIRSGGVPELRYSLGPGGGPVSIHLYDVRGRLVRALENGVQPEGTYRVEWDRRDTTGLRIVRGIYFVRAEIAGARFTDKIAFLRP